MGPYPLPTELMALRASASARRPSCQGRRPGDPRSYGETKNIPRHVEGMRTAPAVGPKPPLLSRHRVTAGLAVGLRAWVLPTGKFPPFSPSKKTYQGPVYGVSPTSLWDQDNEVS